MSSDPPPKDIEIQLFTISDTRDPENDTSGNLMRELLDEQGYSIYGSAIIREDYKDLREAFKAGLDESTIDVVISSGGTGISSRDRTVEVVEELLDKPLPGFGEMFRRLSEKEVGAYTVMSRTLAGRADDTLLLALPGSPNAVQLAFEEILLKILPHMVKEVRK